MYVAAFRQGGHKFVPRDPVSALPLLTQACDAGFAPSCRNVSAMYTLGDGVPADKALADKYFKMTAELFEAQTGQKAPVPR